MVSVRRSFGYGGDDNTVRMNGEATDRLSTFCRRDKTFYFLLFSASVRLFSIRLPEVKKIESSNVVNTSKAVFKCIPMFSLFVELYFYQF